MRYDTESIEKRKNTSKTFKKVLHIVSIILVYNVVLLFFSSINKVQDMYFFGYRAYIITTNSMEPTIKHGDAILSKKVKQDDVKEGDIITFSRNNEAITHRVLRIDKGDNSEELFVTKGDNNNIEDKEKVRLEDIEGKKVMVFPKIGYVIEAAENQLVILIITLVILIFLLGKIQSEEKKYNRREKKKNEAKEKNIL